MVKLDVSFRFSSVPDLIGEALVVALINSALRSLYGQVGASQLIYELKDWNQERLLAHLDVEDKDDAIKIWGGLVLMSSFDSKRCRVQVSAGNEDMALLFPAKPRKKR